MCMLVKVCDAVHSGAHGKLFYLDPFGRAQRGTYRWPYCMARLYVVAFSEKNRRVRYLGNPLICVYNPDSPSGHAPGAQSLIGPAQNELPFHQRGTRLSFNTNISGGEFRLSPGGTGRPMRQNKKDKFAKFEISNPKTKNLKLFTTIFLRDRSQDSFPQDRVLALKISGKTLASALLVLHSQYARCILNASKQCPYEATTSIWLKAMMVCRDLRGNVERSENGIRHGGGIGSPRGGAPRGKSGLILLAERSASTDTAGGYGIPMRNPQRNPMRIPQMPGVRWPDRAPHVGTACRMW
jgi:hypothetical protein